MGRLYIGSDEVENIDEIIVANVSYSGDLELSLSEGIACNEVRLYQGDFIYIEIDKIDLVIEALQKAKELWGDK